MSLKTYYLQKKMIEIRLWFSTLEIKTTSWLPEVMKCFTGITSVLTFTLRIGPLTRWLKLPETTPTNISTCVLTFTNNPIVF